MGRAPCCDKANVKRGPWSPEEDAKLKDFMEKNGTGGNWISFPQKAGLKRCGKSCRLRWLNYLRPHIKHGEFSDDEDRIICTLYANIGSRWSIIAAQLPGRTDNDIKNYWNTKLKKKLMGTIINPLYNQRKIPSVSSYSNSLPITTPSQSQSFSHIYGDFSTPYYTPFIKPNNVPYINTNDNVHLTSNTYHTSNGLTNPMQFCNGKDNMVMFGGGEPSCSSSDGIISYGNFQEGFISNGGYDIEENNKLFDYGDQISAWGDEKQSSFVDTPQISQIQFDLEEVKEMISSSGCNPTEMLVSRQNGFDN